MFEGLLENFYFVLIIKLLGGLGIFLYGINLMGESLKALAGDRLKSIIEKMTGNIFVGIFWGIVVTVLLQTSSGTTALAISLVRAGLMTMTQSLGIIMGANIGTTITAFLIGLKIGKFSPLIIGIGALMIFFFKNKKINRIGGSILGFGLLFYGLELMGGELKELSKLETFTNIMKESSSHPWLAMITGAIMTVIVQSSSATTAILQSLYGADQIPLSGAIPVLFGNNIGTTITAVLASIGGSIAAKRASAFHVFFNVFGAIVFMIFLRGPMLWAIEYLTGLTDASKEMQIAYGHIIFNVINTLVLVWFVSYIITFIKKIIPGDEGLNNEFNEDAFNLDLIEESPVLALESSKNVIIHMAKIVRKMLDETIKYAKEPNAKVFEEAMTLETIINTLDRKIHDYLVKITSHVDEFHSKELSKYLDTIRDLERIGDHCENMLEVFQYIHENKGVLTADAWEDLDEMFNTVSSMLDKCLIIIDENDKKLAEQVIEVEDNVDRLEKKSRKRHTNRVNDGVCTSETGIMFIELLSNLERIGDHCCNIAEYSINEEYYLFIDEQEADLSKKGPKINIQSHTNKK